MSWNEQYTAYATIVRKEATRVFRIWPQTLIPPVVTQTLYFLIFGKLIGSQIGDIHGVSYMAFIVPGLVMMAVINNSFVNVVGSFFSAKFQRSIEEILVSSASNRVIIAGYVTGGVVRGIIVGALVFLVSLFFTRPVLAPPGIIVSFIVLTSVVFALGGFLNAIFAKKFDDISIFPTFILTPLIYLGGVFYSIQSLPPFWQVLSHYNPVLYMVNGFRYGFHGFSDVNVLLSFLILAVLAVMLLAANLFLLARGTGLKT
ncbi:MAG: ABC transporter permease [Omnitrophica WOR_2 bacterium RIFCSPHIGHO2_02_FULL_52_10]|nr:MAG: ABC transporter permease [Omnitrophica WOR_2 bacterium RIFCSPHIGHO2_02_FULL_52_10]